MTDTFPVRRYAHLSLDEKYRYSLERRWGAPGDDLALFIMLNPSTADANIDDPTIRKCMGFARRWHLNGIRVVNLYAYRATNPRDLSACADPEGLVENDRQIFLAVRGCRRIICAWGASPGPHADRPRRVWDLLIEALGPSKHVPRPEALGLTKHGHPRHPLYAPYDLRPVPFEVPS
jgi:hypothetical protein